MRKKTRISLTFSSTNQSDLEILNSIEKFGSGKGVQERAYEVKKLLLFGIRMQARCSGEFLVRNIEKQRVPEGAHFEPQGIETTPEKVDAFLAAPVAHSNEQETPFVQEQTSVDGKAFFESITGVPGFESVLAINVVPKVSPA